MLIYQFASKYLMAYSTNPSILTYTTPFLIERKMETAAEGLSSDCRNLLFRKVFPYSQTNAKTIADYVLALKIEVNHVDHYRGDIIRLLATFSIFFKNQRSFIEITRADLLAFLDGFRKPDNVDPMHKWIGTYNLYRSHLMRFFKWLYYPDIEQKQRPKPPLLENIPQLKRKEKSIYKPTDMWTEEDDSLFLKYCPRPRDRCYHAMSRDSAARPHELLRLRIKDVVFKLASDKKTVRRNGRQW
jgi:integrase